MTCAWDVLLTGVRLTQPHHGCASESPSGPASGGVRTRRGNPLRQAGAGRPRPEGRANTGLPKPGCARPPAGPGPLSHGSQAMSVRQTGSIRRTTSDALRRRTPGASSGAFAVDALPVRHAAEAIIVAEQRIEAGGDLAQPVLCARASEQCAIRRPNRRRHRARRSRRRPARHRPRRRSRRRHCA